MPCSPSSCMGNEAGVPEFRADRTWISASAHDFLSRIPCPLHTATPAFQPPRVPKASFTACTKLATEAEAVTSRSFVRWPEQRHIRAGGSVDFVREIVSPCPVEKRSHGFAVIRYATTTAVICSRCCLRFQTEERTSSRLLETSRRKRIGSSLMSDENEW